MPARLARSSVHLAAPKSARNKNRKRNLDAYSIASHSVPEQTRTRQNRLGEYLDDGRGLRQKRRRVGELDGEEESVEEDIPGTKRRKAGKEDDDVEQGSDSEGNKWTLGGMAEDDEDSDLDSDEAFGESDEERFEGFAFRGSSSTKGKKSTKSAGSSLRANAQDEDIDLDEAGVENVSEDESLGDDAVDLADMLNDNDEDMLGEKDTTKEDMGEESASKEDDDSDGDFDSDSEEDNEEDELDPSAEEERVARLRDRIEAMDGETRPADAASSKQQSALTVEDLLADLDPASQKQFSAATKTRKKSERPTTLAAPLPKRQQDRLDREAAAKKAKEQLHRWRDTIIQNRRAEFLSFPLKHADEADPLGKDRFIDGAPQTELEENIRRIMEESGMASKAGQKPDEDEFEDNVMKAEELATNSIPVEEIMQKRAELRRARELMFREEIKAKRIAKIKSKSYRRVHRRERERAADREREERERFGMEPDQDEKERANRKRAEERMNTKHRDSKWAKTLKQTNRTAWDEGARSGVIEQARRKEELRRRIAGKEVSDGDGSDMPSDDDVDNAADSDDGDEQRSLRHLDKLKAEIIGTGQKKGLSEMKFMRAADDRQRAQNDEDIERLRHELAVQDGDEDESAGEAEDEGLGRAIFGPTGTEQPKPAKVVRPELEEGNHTDDEDGVEDSVVVQTEPTADMQAGRATSSATKQTSSGPLARTAAARGDTYAAPKTGSELNANSWLTGPVEKSKKDQRRTREMNDGAILIDTAPPAAQVQKDNQALQVQASRPKAPAFLEAMHKEAKPNASASIGEAGDTNGWTLVTYGNDNEDHENDHSPDPNNPALTHQEQQAAFHRLAFAGDDVQTTFTAEKADLAASEDEKETSSYLPGWGSWTGTGLSKRITQANTRARHNPLYKTKLPGVKPEARKDAKLENVIISEKGDRKARKYKADLLPHGFEKREQYERALRVPVGPEWTTKETFQRSTRPRVVVKPGVVVGPMERPMV